LDLFANASPQISHRLLDLDRNPRLAGELGIAAYNTGVLERGNETIRLKGTDQDSITSGLLQLTRKTPRTLCFTVGHGEQNPRESGERKGYSEVAKALELENFGIRAIDIITDAGVPQDCTVLVIAGPKKDLLPGEADELDSFLRRGGRALVMVDPDSPASYGEFLNRFGIRPGDDVVVEQGNRFHGADSFMPRVSVRREVFGESLGAPAVFAVARTILPGDENPGGMRIVLLAISSADSWARAGGSPVDEEDLSFRRDVDHPGPLPVGVMVAGSAQAEGTPTAEPFRGQIMVFGDSDFANNLYLNLLGNKDLFMSSIAVLAEDQELVAMRQKSEIPGPISPIYLTVEQSRRIYWVAVVIVPGTMAILGLLVVWRRHQRANR
jgi:ABC-type uncharacterized transport system involved in gliding motility auxiliary subunit